MYSILLVDDDPIILKKLKTDIASNHKNIEVDCATNYKDATTMLSNNQYSIFFLDILLSDSLEEKTGIDLAHYIRSIDKYTFAPIVFVTTIDNKIEEAVNDIHCISYLLKPYTYQQLEKCIDHLLTIPSLEPLLTFRDVTKTTFKIKPSDIVYITSRQHTLFIYGTESSYELTNYSLDSIHQDLSGEFIRCHKSYIVNKDKILDVQKTPLHLKTVLGDIPVGRAYKNTIKEWL